MSFQDGIERRQFLRNGSMNPMQVFLFMIPRETRNRESLREKTALKDSERRTKCIPFSISLPM
jgi:hypothetical protein